MRVWLPLASDVMMATGVVTWGHTQGFDSVHVSCAQQTWLHGQHQVHVSEIEKTSNHHGTIEQGHHMSRSMQKLVSVASRN
jgi:hypothetical protein